LIKFANLFYFLYSFYLFNYLFVYLLIYSFLLIDFFISVILFIYLFVHIYLVAIFADCASKCLSSFMQHINFQQNTSSAGTAVHTARASTVRALIPKTKRTASRHSVEKFAQKHSIEVRCGCRTGLTQKLSCTFSSCCIRISSLP